MRIVLTGGTGFIGSHFINRAHAAGHEITAQRRSPDSRPRVPISRDPKWLDKPLAELAPKDFTGCAALVHLAAHSANVPYDTLENCLVRNFLGPLAMLRAATAAGVKRVIAAGTCFEYGAAGERYDFIPTDAPLEPTSSYAASKAAASVAFHAFACENLIELLTLPIFQVFGEGELETRFWPSLRKAALSGEDFPMSPGLQVRDFIYVTEVADALIAALDRSDILPAHPRIEHVGRGLPQTLIAFASAEWKRLGAAGKLIPGALPMRKNEIMRFVPKMPVNH
jgi:nucleoside-diphosphate-sugar epimerase